jgi:hypothetical protein
LKQVFGKFGKDLGCDIKKGNEVVRVAITSHVDIKRNHIIKANINSSEPLKALERV